MNVTCLFYVCCCNKIWPLSFFKTGDTDLILFRVGVSPEYLAVNDDDDDDDFFFCKPFLKITGHFFFTKKLLY